MANHLSFGGFRLSEFVIFRHEGFLSLFPLRMQLNAVDRTDDFALRLVVVTHALRTCIRVDDVDRLAH